MAEAVFRTSAAVYLPGLPLPLPSGRKLALKEPKAEGRAENLHEMLSYGEFLLGWVMDLMKLVV